MEKTITISVDGMTCEHCVKAVNSALKAINGVKDINVSLEKKNVQVVYNDELTSVADLEAAITEEGYDVKQ